MRRLSTLTPIVPIALAAGLALGAAACGSSSGSTGTTATTPAAAQAPGSSATGTPAGTTDLKVSSSALGDIVVDGEGRTLYVFTADDGTTTACTGGCSSTWPALVAPATAGSGVTGAVTEATQADGATQVALGGHLLYYYAADTAPGATSGQGVGGKWFVVDGTGKAITTTASKSSGY